MERRFNERTDKEMDNIIDTVEDRIQNAILTAIDSIINPRVELTVKSLNTSSGRDAVIVTGNSERGNVQRLLPFLKTYPKVTTHFMIYINAIDETRGNIPHDLSELSVPRTHFDRQSHSHPNWAQPPRLTAHPTWLFKDIHPRSSKFQHFMSDYGSNHRKSSMKSYMIQR